MSHLSIPERLRQLASNDSKRPKAARLRDVIDDVENALAAGIPLSEVLSVLNEGGLDMTLPSFKNALYRIRKERDEKANRKKPKVSEQQKAMNKLTLQNPVEEVKDDVLDNKPSTNPADLDKIIGSTPDLDALAKAAKARRK